MRTITTTEDLARFCDAAREGAYVTIDTEFIRERTYYARLCLIQMALPGDGEAVLVDPIEGDISLDPLFDLFRDESTVKVLHAARQDLEIFYIQGGVFPRPLFDTQVAAMVCGFGEQVGYETLVRKVAKASLDKTSRFTDWARRPLSDAQKAYALADVTHLRVIYEVLSEQIRSTGRIEWVEEELRTLTDPATYVVDPATAWMRVKTRTNSGKFLSLVRELARFREEYAQSNDIPRSRVFKDDALLELASTKPTSQDALARSRLLQRDARRGAIADGILGAVRTAQAAAPEDHPVAENGRAQLDVDPALADLLRVLLKTKSEESGVAAKLIASAADLDAIAGGMRDLPALSGWRKEVFGDDALRLCRGEIALGTQAGRIAVIAL